MLFLRVYLVRVYYVCNKYLPLDLRCINEESHDRSTALLLLCKSHHEESIKVCVCVFLSLVTLLCNLCSGFYNLFGGYRFIVKSKSPSQIFFINYSLIPLELGGNFSCCFNNAIPTKAQYSSRL